MKIRLAAFLGNLVLVLSVACGGGPEPTRPAAIREPQIALPTDSIAWAPSETIPATLRAPATATAKIPATIPPTITRPSPVIPTPVRDITVDLSAELSPSPQPTSTVPSVYTAFDMLRGYLTNRTHPIMFDGQPWANGTLNVQQYQQELEGVTYWDFISEHENWDSPAYMWQDDDGNWRPYDKETVPDKNGRQQTAYVLLDRKGPGAMDKLWFTQDAVWMLTTPESTRDVGPIQNMDEFIEWGNLEKLGNIRIEVDGHIVYDADLRDWISGKAWGLASDMAQILTWRHREYGSTGTLLPVLYQKHLRISVYGGSKKPKWFLATGIRFGEDVHVKPYGGTTQELPLGQIAGLVKNVLQPETFIDTLGGTRSIELGVQPKLVSSIRFPGSGTIGAWQMRIAKKGNPREMWLRIKYGDQTAINLPLIAFFGDQKELTPHRSTPLGIVETGDSMLFYSNLPLPFQNGLTLELTTNNPSPVVAAMRFAASRETTNTQLWVEYQEPKKQSIYGPDYQVKLGGNGKLIGLVLESDDQGLDLIPKILDPKNANTEDLVKRAWPMGYLEGNLTLLDGEGRTRIFGGQEDWADGGFYFNRGYTSPGGGSNRPFGGILRYQDGKDGYATLFRYFNDLAAFPFKNGLTLSFGHGTWNNNFPVSYGTTVYYYRQVDGAPKTVWPLSP